MADTKTSALTAGAQPSGSDTVYPAVQGGVSVKVTSAQQRDAILADAATTEKVQDIVGAQITAGANVTAAYDDAGTGGITLTAGAVLTVLNKSVNYTVLAADLGNTIRVDASAAGRVITLPATASDGALICVRKIDTQQGDRRTNDTTLAGNVTVNNNGGTALAWLQTQYDTVWFICISNTWTRLWQKIAPVLDVYSTVGSATYYQYPLAISVAVECVGGGGSGGSGASGDSTSARGGGGGGGAGAVQQQEFTASSLSSTVALTIGDGGASVNGVTNASGNPGNAGSASSFASYLVARGGARGSGGTASAGSGGGAGSQVAISVSQGTGSTGATPGSGASGSVSGTAPSAGSKGSDAQYGGGPGGGGSGGGLVITSPVAGAGSAGGAGHNSAAGGLLQQTSANTGGGGTAGAASGGVGSPGTGYSAPWYGDGGGGSGSSITTVGGVGGDGGAPGGGGGGTGATDNTHASGATGKGGRGEIRILTKF